MEENRRNWKGTESAGWAIALYVPDSTINATTQNGRFAWASPSDVDPFGGWGVGWWESAHTAKLGLVKSFSELVTNTVVLK